MIWLGGHPARERAVGRAVVAEPRCVAVERGLWRSSAQSLDSCYVAVLNCTRTAGCRGKQYSLTDC
jgi:hypothetical protein